MTQRERSSGTRARLISATLDLMMERGYARTTVAEIAERAGVTRGALSHHFAGKDDLVVHSVESQLAVSIAEIRALAERVRAGSLDLRDFIDALWSMFSGRLFLITLEHVTEARHNPALREKLIPVVREFHAALDRTWHGFFEGAPEAEVETAFNATLCLLRGMGLQTVLRDDPAYYGRLAGYWTGILAERTHAGPAHPKRQAGDA